MSQFPWKVTKENLIQFFERPYLFLASYRIFRGAYYGQGFQICEMNVESSPGFQDRFNQLPLEIVRTLGVCKDCSQKCICLYELVFIRLFSICYDIYIFP